MDTTDPSKGIIVDVSGPGGTGKTLVCGIIQNALEKAGYSDVVSLDQAGITQENNNIRTTLDAVRASRPELFDLPIQINEITIDGDVEIVELSDMTIRVSDDDEPVGGDTRDDILAGTDSGDYDDA